MRLGWAIPLPGPLFLSGTVLRSRRGRHHRRCWHGTLPGWQCRHNHRTIGRARACADREARRKTG